MISVSDYDVPYWNLTPLVPTNNCATSLAFILKRVTIVVFIDKMKDTRCWTLLNTQVFLSYSLYKFIFITAFAGFMLIR